MRTLDEIAVSCGTDKSSQVHNYTQQYEKYFESLREKSISILEIGIQQGKSLKMWQEYFPSAKIYGMDNKNCDEFCPDGVYTILADQGKKKHLLQVAELCGPFDIIIDDGSHINKDLLLTFDTLFPLLKPGGLYVAEDLHTCYWGRGFGRPTFPKRLKKLLDEIMASGKSGLGDRTKDAQLGGYEPRRGKMTWWDTNVEFMHLYRSIAFIKRV